MAAGGAGSQAPWVHGLTDSAANVSALACRIGGPQATLLAPLPLALAPQGGGGCGGAARRDPAAADGRLWWAPLVCRAGAVSMHELSTCVTCLFPFFIRSAWPLLWMHLGRHTMPPCLTRPSPPAAAPPRSQAGCAAEAQPAGQSGGGAGAGHQAGAAGEHPGGDQPAAGRLGVASSEARDAPAVRANCSTTAEAVTRCSAM